MAAVISWLPLHFDSQLDLQSSESCFERQIHAFYSCANLFFTPSRFFLRYEPPMYPVLNSDHDNCSNHCHNWTNMQAQGRNQQLHRRSTLLLTMSEPSGVLQVGWGVQMILTWVLKSGHDWFANANQYLTAYFLSQKNLGIAVYTRHVGQITGWWHAAGSTDLHKKPSKNVAKIESLPSHMRKVNICSL